MSKAAIDLPIEIKLPIGKLSPNLEEIEEDLEDLDDDLDLIDDSDEDPDSDDDPDKVGKAKGAKKRASQTKKKHFTEDSIRLYLQEIGRIRLLRADEEIELARKIADLLELELKREEIATEVDCHPDDVRESDWAIKMGMPLGDFRKRLHSGRRAKDKMVQSNLRLVVSIAKKYMNRGLSFQDLIQEGSLGLIRAAEKFDHEKGYKFSTYATWWIRQAITRAIADQSRTIRLPVHLYETISRIKKTTKLLSQEMGRKPTEEEIATRLVVSIAKKYMNRGLSFQDLIQEGSLGLIRAAEKFDHEKGYKFSTYATWWIRQAITRAIADQSRTIRLPVHLYETISRIKKTTKLLSQEMGRKPTEEEIATRMEMTIEKLRFIAKSAQLPISLETPIGKEEDSRLGDFIESEGETPDDQVAKSLLREDLESVLGTLSPRERDVLRLRYGLDDGRMKTLEEIGQIFNVTRERIRQIEAKALRKLRHPNRNSVLKEYIR